MTQSRSVLDIPLFHKIYSLYKMLYRFRSRIPKAGRYTLWQKCENTTLNLLESLIATRYRRGGERLSSLHQMSHQLDLLKVFIRLAKETQIITPQHYLEIQIYIQEAGKMIGGWIKSVPH